MLMQALKKNDNSLALIIKEQLLSLWGAVNLFPMFAAVDPITH